MFVGIYYIQSLYVHLRLTLGAPVYGRPRVGLTSFFLKSFKKLSKNVRWDGEKRRNESCIMRTPGLWFLVSFFLRWTLLSYQWKKLKCSATCWTKHTFKSCLLKVGSNAPTVLLNRKTLNLEFSLWVREPSKSIFEKTKKMRLFYFCTVLLRVNGQSVEEIMEAIARKSVEDRITLEREMFKFNSKIWF